MATVSSERKKIVVNFRHRTSDANWYDIFDRFYLAVSPEWFRWLSWTGIIAAIQYVEDKHPSIWLALLIGLSTLFIWRYFYALLEQVEFVGLPFLSSPRSIALASHLISGGLAFVAWRIAIVLAQVLKNK
jgi:hypothetical protein